MHIILSLGVFSIGYLIWSRYIEKNLKVDCIKPTPAIEKYDRIDFVPTKFSILFGHHFSSITGIIPIVGPILALKFGWLPTFLWLVFGAVLIGAMHDFASVILSVRNGGKTIGDIMRNQVSPIAGKIYIITSLLTVVIIISIFTNIVAESFSNSPISASTATFITLSSLIVGLAIKKLNLSQGIALILAIVLLLISLFLGYKFPLSMSKNTWVYIILLYSFCASWLPIWILLQPRDYISFFLFFPLILISATWIILKNPEIKLFAIPDGIGFLDLINQVFPFIFITVSCGAVSGFHSLVSAGTTSKQLSSECQARPIGYGAMLLESLLGIIAITSISIFTYDAYIQMIGENSNKVLDAFAYGISELSFGIDKNLVKDFSIITISALALSSIDTATRIGRYILGEIVIPVQDTTFTKKKLFFSFALSAVIILVSYFFINLGGADVLWQILGTSNQLLAAFALITTAIWAKKNKLKNYYFIIPAIFMFTLTTSALYTQTKRTFNSSDKTIFGISIILLTLAVIVFVISIKEYIRPKNTPQQKEKII